MPEEDALTEIYADSFRFSLTPYGVSFTFGLNTPHPVPTKATPPRESLVLRMSLESAKVLVMMLTQKLKAYERDNSLEIALPPGLYTQLGVAREDWA